jgi:hypothetical protein
MNINGILKSIRQIIIFFYLDISFIEIHYGIKSIQKE